MVPAAITQLSLRQSSPADKSLSHPEACFVGEFVVVLVIVVVVLVVSVVVLIVVAIVDAVVDGVVEIFPPTPSNWCVGSPSR